MHTIVIVLELAYLSDLRAPLPHTAFLKSPGCERILKGAKGQLFDEREKLKAFGK